MIRRIWKCCSFLSLALFAATVVLWARSYFVADTLELTRSGIDRPHDHGEITDGYSIGSSKGTLLFSFEEREDRGMGMEPFADNPPPLPPREPPKTMFSYDRLKPWNALGVFARPPGTRSCAHAGFAFQEESYMGAHSSGDVNYVALPIYSLSVVTALFAFPFVRSTLVRRRRVRKNCCLSCGYDLRATPERCPECGVVAELS